MDTTGTFAAADLRFGGGLTEDDRDLVTETLNEIITRLARVPRGVDAELHVKDRDSKDPRTTLEVTVDGQPRLVVTSGETELRDALNDVSDLMVRRLNEQSERRDPRHHRETIRG